MKAMVTESYERAYSDPMAVLAGQAVTPDFGKRTDLAGWVWCTAKDNRSGWAPRDWLVRDEGKWHLERDFDAIELTVFPGEILEIEFEESGFYWVKTDSGDAGWVPCDRVSLIE